jgi:uncharacterized protein (TIGR00369 family)
MTQGETMTMATPEAGFGVTPIEQARAVDGLTLMTGIMDGRFPAPPIAKALGFWMTLVEPGRVIFDYEPVFDHYNPLGTVHGGIATLLDSVMGCCVHTMLKAGSGFTTLEIKVNYVRALTDKTGLVHAEGKIINVGSRIATSEGRLTDSAGKLLAHGTTTCLIFPL